MKLQAFLFKRVKVRGPMGLHEEERGFPTGSGDISHAGNLYPADEHGWAEVADPTQAQALKALRFTHPLGGVVRYCSPDEVDENLRLGLIEQGAVQSPVEERRPAQRPQKPHGG